MTERHLAMQGRRPVKTKVERLPSQFFRWLGARARVDVVAQQVLDHDDGIFRAVKENDARAAVALIDANEYCLLLRDSVGAAPIHLAFLFGHYELGKLLVLRARRFATLTYALMDRDAAEPSPYDGENILHIAIVHRQAVLVTWLLAQAPELIHAETTGRFFRPRKACYFGGSPLLFALSSNQVSVALDILAAAATTPLPASAAKDTNGASARPARVCPETSIFMCDRFGNNALHMAVIHDLPNVYDFALQYAMGLLSPAPAAPAATATSHSTNTILEECVSAADGFTAIQAHDASSSSLPPMLDASEATKRSPLAQLHARFASFSTAAGPVEGDSEQPQDTTGRDSLADFLKRADDAAHDAMVQFLMQRNSDELTPLSLAAAIGNQRMFQHILQQATFVAWTYGPITALNVPLLDLEQPIPRPDPDFGTFQVVYDVLATLPYPLALKGTRCYKTAIQCLCSVEPLSNTLSSQRSAMQSVVSARLEMLKLLEVKLLLHKKWKYVGKRRFMARLGVYALFLTLLNATTLFKQSTYASASRAEAIALGVAECMCLALTLVKFLNESNQLLFSFRSYTTETGAGQLDNVCTLVASTSLFLSAAMRAAGLEHLEDATAAVALIFAWFYLFFFLLGFRSTGPFVIMILTMIATDIVRFIAVYFAVMAGFSQALYLVQDGRAGVATLLHRVRVLVIAGFTGEVNYDDNYTSGRMNPFTQVLMVAYVILVMILLVNLLIAMYVLLSVLLLSAAGRT